MKGILIKDFITIKKSFWQIFLIYAVFSVTGIVASQPSWCAIGTMMASIIPMVLIEIDEGTNWLKYIFCTPVGKKNYVLSKYVIEVFFVVTGYLIVLVGIVLSSLIKKDGALSELGMMTDLIFVSTFLMSSLVVPLSLKVGAVKSRIILVIIYTILGSVIGNFSGYIRNAKPDIFESFSSNLTFHIIVCILSLALFALSYSISLRIVNKKEY